MSKGRAPSCPPKGPLTSVHPRSSLYCAAHLRLRAFVRFTVCLEPHFLSHIPALSSLGGHLAPPEALSCALMALFWTPPPPFPTSRGPNLPLYSWYTLCRSSPQKHVFRVNRRRDEPTGQTWVPDCPVGSWIGFGPNPLPLAVWGTVHQLGAFAIHLFRMLLLQR